MAKSVKFAKIMVCCLIFVLPYSLHAQTRSDPATLESLHGFVQEFYDWYVPEALSDSIDPAWSLALKARGSVFSHQLAKALEEDSAAQTRAEGEIVGLDFDPFLSSQDPGQHYKVGRITQKGDGYWVDIHDASSSEWVHEKPSVIAEVVRKNGQWHFVNFHYSNGRDLLDALKELKASRGKPSSQAIRGIADESQLST